MNPKFVNRVQLRHWIWSCIGLAGATAGAFGTRLFASAPDITLAADLPVVGLVIFPLFALLFARLVIATHGRRARLFFHLFLGLGIYGTFYGLFELAFHALNHRHILSSVSVLLFGLDICFSCALAGRLFGHLIPSDVSPTVVDPHPERRMD